MSSMPGELSFWEHVEELRSTLLIAIMTIALGVGGSFFFYQPLLLILTSPYAELFPQTGALDPLSGTLILRGPLDGFLTVLKVSLWSGIVFSAPVWVYLGMRFIFPGLKKRERRAAFFLYFGSLSFFALGLLFAFYVSLPIATRLLFQFNQGLGTNLWGLGPYLDYVIGLSLGNGLAFEFFIVLVFLVHFGFVNEKALKAKRRLSIVGIFVVAAVLTPPDVLTQCLVAGPLVLFYETAILYAKWRTKTARASSSTEGCGPFRQSEQTNESDA